MFVRSTQEILWYKRLTKAALTKPSTTTNDSTGTTKGGRREETGSALMVSGNGGRNGLGPYYMYIGLRLAGMEGEMGSDHIIYIIIGLRLAGMEGETGSNHMVSGNLEKSSSESYGDTKEKGEKLVPTIRWAGHMPCHRDNVRLTITDGSDSYIRSLPNW